MACCSGCAKGAGCAGTHGTAVVAVPAAPFQRGVSGDGRERLTTPYLPAVGFITPAGIAWRETAPNVSTVGTRAGAGDPLWSTVIGPDGAAEVCDLEPRDDGAGWNYFGGITAPVLPARSAKA